MKEVTRFPDRKMVKQLLSWFRQHVIRAKTSSRMTTATTFSRQNDAASRASTTWYWENLVLVLVLVLESKGLYCRVMRDDIKHSVQIWYYDKAGPTQTADNDYCTTPKKRMTNWNAILFSPLAVFIAHALLLVSHYSGLLWFMNYSEWSVQCF